MSNPVWKTKDIGPVDAYALAVEGGYTGTKEQWVNEIGNASTNAQTASTKAAEAASSATTASQKADLAQAWATGGSGGTPSATNNCKYYRDSAAAIAAGDVIDDTAGAGDVDLTWSADKLSGLKSALSTIETPLEFVLNDNSGIGYEDGQPIGTESYMRTSYIDVSGYEYLFYARVCVTGSSSNYGVAFYKDDKTYISGVQNELNYAQSKYVMNLVSVPDDAKYFRASVSKALPTDLFAVYGLHDLASFDPKVINTIESILTNDVMIRRTLLTSSDNLDNVNVIGCYAIGSGSLPTNTPVEESGQLVVFAQRPSNQNGRKVQMFICASGIYYRSQASNGYLSWNKLKNEEEKSEYEYNLKLYPGFGIASTGKQGSEFYGRKVYSTEKLIKIPENRVINFKSNESCYITRIAIYDDSGFVGLDNTAVALSSNEYAPITIASGKYVGVTVKKNTEQTLDFYPDITIKGQFEEENPTCFLPSINNGNINLSLTIPIYNEELTEDLKSDYGVLALPASYTAHGKPTRLMIYCHGAGTHYTPGTDTFNDDESLDPTFFLSEGYAVMDIDGNPYNDTYAQFYIPESLQCYIAAYEFVKERYNICQDGIILGGRSMGGAQCIEIMQSEEIPVKACFTVATTYNFPHYFNTRNATTRKFLATHYGIPGASTFEWTSNNPMTSAEWNKLKENFKIVLQNSPSWKYLETKFDADVLMNDAFNVASNTASLPVEAELFNNLQSRIRIPVKIYYAEDDTSAPYQRNSMYLYNQLMNSGSRVFIKGYATGGHHFELANQNLVASWTNSKGETLTDVPEVYIDAFNFFRQYE